MRTTLLFALIFALASPARAAPPTLSAQNYRDDGARMLEAKRYQEAVTALEHALEVSPDYGEAWVDLGNARLALGEFGPAAQAFESAVKFSPDIEIAQYNLAYALRRNGSLPKAADAYRAYLTKHPEDADAHYGLGETLRALGDKTGAADAYERYAAAESRADRQSWVERAKKLALDLRGGAPAPKAAVAAPVAAATTPAPEAKKTAPAIEREEPQKLAHVRSTRPAAFDAGIAKLKGGDYQGALADLERARAEAPEDPWINAAIGSAELGLAEPERAAASYRRALAAPKAESGAAAFRFGLAEALRSGGSSKEAAVEYKTVADDPKAPADLKKLAAARLALTK